MQEFIPYARHAITPQDMAAVHEALSSDYIARGPLNEYFEQALAAYCGANYAVAVSSGTAALHLAYKALGVLSGDHVITPPISFVATANGALYNGAIPNFVDIESRYFCIDPEQLVDHLKECPKDEWPKVVAGVSFAGQPYDMESVWNICQDAGIKVLADQSHALGSSWYDSSGKLQYVGNCAYADLEVLSFQATKNITTGEGGAILTNDEQLYHTLLELRNHGITKSPEKLEQNPGPWYYEMHALGYNYRMTEFQAALGLQQLHRLNDIIIDRQKLVALYNAIFKIEPRIKLPDQRPHVQHAWHLYVVGVPQRDTIYNLLSKENVGSQVHYIPIHLQPYYRKRFGYSAGDFPIAEKYYHHALSLPLYPTLSHNQLEYVGNTLLNAIQTVTNAHE